MKLKTLTPELSMRLREAAEALQEICDSAYERETDVAMSTDTADSLWRLLRSASEALSTTE